MRSRDIYLRGKRVISNAAQTGLRSEMHYPEPLIPEKAHGCKIIDADGREYTDYHLAFGPIILGHSYPEVDDYVKHQIDEGILFGAGLCEIEVRVAEKLVELIPSAEMVNFVNSGTEATYIALRLARAFTGREKIIKFEGCYHGWHDFVAFNVYPPADKIGKIYPQSKGILKSIYKYTVSLPFNDAEIFEDYMAENHDNIAAVILEPVPHSVGAIIPEKQFLRKLREITSTYGTILIFDEIITGIRHNIHGVQSDFNVIPDLTTIGKAMGNGYPIASVVGKKEIMSQIHNGVLVSGTYSGHPVSLAATEKTLEIMERDRINHYLTDLGDKYRKALSDIIEDNGYEARVIGYKSIFALQFATGPVRDYSSMIGLDSEKYRRFSAEMRKEGILFTPNHLKRLHLSASHGVAEFEAFIDAAESVLRKIN